MLPKRFRIEGELHEDVHFLGFLAHHKLTVVRRRELIQTEEAQIGEDLVQDVIVAISAARATLKENFRKNLKTRQDHQS